MEAPPLTLSVLHLRPTTLLYPPDDEPPIPLPLSPQPQFTSNPPPVFSPTHNYPAPYPSTTLGSVFQLELELNNTSKATVAGVRMMVEIQTPNTRFRLGEIIHSDGKGDPESNVLENMPELGVGEAVALKVDSEVKEVGACVCIVSVAWETVEGRRTFQRFFRYTVNPPLVIKTRIHSTPHPNTSLDAVMRDRLYLEILAQNVGLEGMVFDNVFLEPVNGLISTFGGKLPRLTSVEGNVVDNGLNDSDLVQDSNRTEEINNETREEGIPVENVDSSIGGKTLLPGETRQYLFVLTPSPTSSSTSTDETTDASVGEKDIQSIAKSTFPSVHAPGTIIPLGRLDLTWRSGPSHDPGRLQTSTLNRRIPVAPLAPINHSRSEGLKQGDWEFDLVVLDRRHVSVEDDFKLNLRLGIRTALPLDEEIDNPPRPEKPLIGVQSLTRKGNDNDKVNTHPKVVLSPPERSNTPSSSMSRNQTNSPRPFSPPISSSRNLSAISHGPSRPMTPISSQLRQASSSNINSPSLLQPSLPSLPIPNPAPFPPSPIVTRPGMTLKSDEKTISGQIDHLGSSLQILSVGDLSVVEEKAETTYTDPVAPLRRWECTVEFSLSFIALQEGLTSLGGLRVLVFDDTTLASGVVGREWESLGDVWVSG